MSEKRAEAISRLFNNLQLVRFGIEQIVAQPGKIELNQQRASSAEKLLRNIESEMRELLQLPTREEIRAAVVQATSRDPNAHLGSDKHQ